MADRPRYPGLEVDENRLAAYRAQRARQMFWFLSPRKWPFRVVQAPPPTATSVNSTDCSSCATRGVRSQMAWIEPGFWLCNRCGLRQKPK